MPDSETTSTRDDALAELALTGLGAESPTERRVKRIVPWVVSVALHVGVIAIGFLVTWTVVRLQPEEEPIVVVADFYSVEYEPVTTPTPPEAAPAREKVEAPQLAPELAERLAAIDADALDVISDAASSSALASFAPQPSADTATFVGLRSSNARKIVYVIDASGSMIRALPIVVLELARSLEGLTPKQRFAVFFFQRNESVAVPPGRLALAEPAARAAALQWINQRVIPAGRSNPLAAIRAALALEPDVIFLLSENITGSGQFEIDQRELLDLLDRLNPIDPDIGRRRTQINCVQFLDPDPLDTLRHIAKEHGGENGYKFLSREELGLGGP